MVLSRFLLPSGKNRDKTCCYFFYPAFRFAPYGAITYHPYGVLIIHLCVKLIRHRCFLTCLNAKLVKT